VRSNPARALDISLKKSTSGKICILQINTLKDMQKQEKPINQIAENQVILIMQ
jgi:hypothetical protein